MGEAIPVQTFDGYPSDEVVGLAITLECIDAELGELVGVDLVRFNDSVATGPRVDQPADLQARISVLVSQVRSSGALARLGHAPNRDDVNVRESRSEVEILSDGLPDLVLHGNDRALVYVNNTVVATLCSLLMEDAVEGSLIADVAAARHRFSAETHFRIGSWIAPVQMKDREFIVFGFFQIR